MSERKKGIITFLVIGMVVALVTVLTKWPIHTVTETVDGVEKTHYAWTPGVPISFVLCDGFFVAGVLVLGMGVLKFCRNKGTFDIISYGVSTALYTAIPVLNLRRPQEQQNEDFYAYTQRKQEERKPAGEMLIAGAILLGLAVLMLAIYLIGEK